MTQERRTKSMTKIRASILLSAALACCPFVGGCSVIKWFANPQPRVEFRVDDYARPEAIVGEHALVYRPALDDAAAPSTDGGEEALLLAYAPVIVQGVIAPDDDAYPRESDRLGAPELEEDGDGYRVLVDGSRPCLYTRVDRIALRGERLLQLIYAYWYPRHPVGGIQKGRVDGGVLRVTLDSRGQAIVHEHVQSCGCYHGVFVAEEIEREARRQFGSPEEGKKRYTERDVEGRVDWVVRDVVLSPPGSRRPVLFLGAGHHDCRALQTEAVVRGLDRFPSARYSLSPYAVLTRLPPQGKEAVPASMFDAEGRVWGGRRWGEEIVFPSMLHPGWPRHIDKVLIHWDEARFTDPGLLERYLRLPLARGPGRLKGGRGETLEGETAETPKAETVTAETVTAETVTAETPTLELNP
jgi:hypothetical protein